MSDPLYLRDQRPINGAFKGRGRNYLALLACPQDGAKLTLCEAGVCCSVSAEHIYPFEEGILRLVAPDRRAALDAEVAAYEEACAAAGWAVPDEAQFKALPQTGLPGYPDDYWSQRAESTALLWRFLEAIRLQEGGLPVGPMGEAAVIGAGMGWLAYGLDVAGYTTIALDWRAGPRYGLGVYPIARYLRVQADPQQLPLARAAFDWLIFQNGLAALGDEKAQERAFAAALEALRPGGWVAVLDAAPPPERADAVRALFRTYRLVAVETPHNRTWRDAVLGLRQRLSGQGSKEPPSVLVARKEK
jgi:SAM-dependent methyltransferase